MMNDDIKLPDDAAAFMYPSALDWLKTREHSATAWSIKVGSPDEPGPAVPLYTADQLRAAVLADRETHKKLLSGLAKIIHDMVVAQQAAWIEWQHGRGADAAMSWISNGLEGPGHIPDEDAPYGKEPQAWYDANCANPFPQCFCGRPSNILSSGHGYCSAEHSRQADAQRAKESK